MTSPYPPTVERRAAIVADVLRAYAAWGPGSVVGGEWNSIRREARQTLLTALDAADASALDTILFNHVARVEWCGLWSPMQVLEYDVATWAALVGSQVSVDSLKDESGRFYPDTPRHDLDARWLTGLGVRRVLEIGGGYGGLALRLLQHRPAIRCVDIDLADTLYLAYGFLAARLPAGAVTLGYDPGAAISLVPDCRVPTEALGAFDVAVNFRSFGEMGRDDVARYFALIEALAPPVVVHENAALRPADEPDTTHVSHPELLIADYPPLPSYTVRAQTVPPWIAGQSRYIRQKLVRHRGAPSWG